MELFLTPASISYIAQTIIFVGIMVYLILKNNGTKANFWLSGAFTIMVAAGLAGFVGVSSLQFQNEGMLIHDTLLVLGIALFTQFAFNFSSVQSIGKKQAKSILWLNTFLSIAAIALSAIHLMEYVEHPIILELVPIIVQIFLVLEITGLMIFFIYLTVKLSTNNTEKRWLYKFFHPQGRSAIATQGFSITSLILWVFWLSSIVLSVYGYKTVAFFIFTLATTWALSFFVITLIDQTIRQASFTFKFILIIMLTTFTGISAASWLTAPAQKANFLATFSIPNSKTIQFEQNNAIFAINSKEINFIEDLGEEIVFDSPNFSIPQNLETTFPFSGKNWETIQIHQKGFVALSENPVNSANLSLPGNPTPTIATLYIKDFYPSNASKVFFNTINDKSIITWFLTPDESNDFMYVNTQLVLDPDGSFNVTFNDVRVQPDYDPYIPEEMHMVSGFFLGENDKFPSRVNFSNQTPLSSVNWKGMYQDYYIDFRNHLHWSIAMQFIAMLLVGFFMVIIYPIFIHQSLVKPIQTLRNGFSKIILGELPEPIEPRFSDDLGQATFEFNHMVRALNDKHLGFEKRNKEVEDKLTLRSIELKHTLEKLADEIDKKNKIKNNLEFYIQENQKLQITDEFGCFNRPQLISELENEIKRAKRYNTPLSMVILDPDYLRMINETYGFSTGSEVLHTLVKLLMDNIRDTDIVGRISGEEFAIIMPQTAGKEAVIGADRIRNLIGANPVETSKGQVRLSVSMGVLEIPKEGVPSIDLIFHQASLALETAKRKGRNQTILYTSSLEKKK
ncbi:MAG TPA: diguanylate cyclase [Anaerolineaceae bacterium]|nr:diguanylate cyclase [Anaerolineaceae bacterium]